MLTVLACVTLVVTGIVGAVEMEDHLAPRTDWAASRDTPSVGSER